MMRLLLATPFAAAISVGLFAFMAWMVNNDGLRSPQQNQSLSFNMVMVEQEQEVQRRQRAVPEQPKAPEPPPKAPVSKQQSSVANTLTPTSVPSLGLDTAINGIAINAPTFGDFGANQQALPLYRVEPTYPARALQRNIEGYVVLRFTIDETGRPTEIEVLDANPRRMFEREAMQALRSWKYQPKLLDGSAVTQPGQTVKLEFKLAK
ncbi:energy transducer TonB [Vibrio cincinnatiensis]|jgi:protein TonB|uniref:Protein TonB n=1 Tax=Vibrio cincinnatiensis DSM 19608 TaxID=1123491 RepID=A0A1T4RJF6_VIBCI|nr:energy transducer TonB [Vibrio cincinnatiensis]MCG3721323.1 energy transducer TonB [Vibrio cincinnatiensis]MCG3725626.1 energy transducer TonB [Vibrio cincinnatiensis]MCG3736217.1 energy transducer TonB [Vibrio cincinnatiensis]MCG3742700.1 energy transducer TonB [Vibrio cincinnatiensis]MCG3764652.1 energy transducer TonB [Vibrio cincinnatiensis]